MTKNPPLADQIKVRQHYLRSAHLEHHEGQSIDGYIPTGRGLEVLHRVGRAMASKDAGRAWSLTGPYGSGKSSFGLFVHALFGPDEDPARASAEAAIAAVDPELLDRLAAGRRVLGAGARGFIRASATAQREPISATILRALTAGAYAYWRTRMPEPVKQALSLADRERDARSIGLALEALCKHAPVLIEIDEFGKNLEHFAGDTAETDLFVLQEIAERCTGERGLPAVLITFQHLAFDDYVRSASAVQRREWGKVQGRFEDIPFIESAEQSLRLVAGTFESTGTPAFKRSQRAWASAEEAACAKLGLGRMLPGGAGTIASCYPLHPVTLIALPEMCARFGQHGRTLFSFLTSREPYSVAEFLGEQSVTAPLPTVGLDRLYDFFITNATGGSRHAARLTEIETTLRETTGLSDDQRRVLKVVGVLNVLSQGGPLRASVAVVRYALSSSVTVNDRQVSTLLEDLQARGVLTYRGFADEYRLWQGSDLDLTTLVEQSREELTGASAAQLLTGQHSMPPAIAGKHSQRVGMLRYFDTVLADASTKTIDGPTIGDGADGLLVYFLGTPAEADQLVVERSTKPVLIATTIEHASIEEAVLELAAVLRTLERTDVQADRVARRELQDRAADARRRLLDRVSRHLHPAAAGVQFRRAGSSEVVPVGRGLSSLLSGVCDDVYKKSPEIANEMLGRRELTSQAAKARRELLTAMVDHGGEEWLGMSGFGPEKAMYAALLRHTGIHRQVDGVFGWHAPKPASMKGVWAAMEILLNKASSEQLNVGELYSKLMAPPYGMKEGAIPVLLTALLLHRVEDVAVYQEGTYQPRITPDLLERLVKSPDRFTVKHFQMTDTRIRTLEATSAAVAAVSGRTPVTGRRPAGSRNHTLLGTTGPLLTAVRELPPYTLRTTALSADARAVRDAILSAREPDELIFTALPAAVGMSEELRKTTRAAAAAGFQQKLEDALRELTGAFDALLEQCRRDLADQFSVRNHELGALRAGLRHHAEPLQAALTEPRLRSFVMLAANEDLEDDSWLEAVLNNIAGRASTSWRDDDVKTFQLELRAVSGAFRRYLALHHSANAREQVAGFQAHRVTITSPDGQEYDDVVWVEEASRTDLQRAAEEALAAAQKLAGPRGGGALLALLAGIVVGEQEHRVLDLTSTESKATTATRGASHA